MTDLSYPSHPARSPQAIVSVELMEEAEQLLEEGTIPERQPLHVADDPEVEWEMPFTD